MLRKTIQHVERVIFQWWWVICFVLFCYMLYEQGLRLQSRDYMKLYQRQMELSRDKQKALEKYEDLKLQIKSQQDPAWIEMTLMRELGVVPEGQTKVFFVPSE